MNHDSFQVGCSTQIWRSLRAIGHCIYTSVALSLIRCREVSQNIWFLMSEQLWVILDGALARLNKIWKLFSIKLILFVTVLVQHIVCFIHLDWSSERWSWNNSSVADHVNTISCNWSSLITISLIKGSRSIEIASETRHWLSHGLLIFSS